MNVRRGVLAAVAIGVLTGLLAAGIAGAAEPVAVLTEIRAGQGEIRVKLAGEADWKAPQPLLSLRPGDQVRASADARRFLDRVRVSSPLAMGEIAAPPRVLAELEAAHRMQMTLHLEKDLKSVRVLRQIGR